jgi:hypothetical protein
MAGGLGYYGRDFEKIGYRVYIIEMGYKTQ